MESNLEAAKLLGIKFILVKRTQLEYPEVARTVDEMLSAVIK